MSALSTTTAPLYRLLNEGEVIQPTDERLFVFDEPNMTPAWRATDVPGALQKAGSWLAHRRRLAAPTCASRPPLVEAMEAVLSSLELLSYLPPEGEENTAYRAAYAHQRAALVALSPGLATTWPAAITD